MSRAIEILVVRDPDGDTDVLIFVDGRQLTYDEYTEEVVDAGRGYTEHDWNQTTTEIENNFDYSPGFRQAVVEARRDPPGNQYIDEDR